MTSNNSKEAKKYRYCDVNNIRRFVIECFMMTSQTAPLFRHSSRTRRPPTRDVLSMRELRAIPRRGRKTPQDTFEPPKTDREWWRVTLKETPVPGTYEFRDFLEDKELNKIKATYNFKGEGRKKQWGVVKNGRVLLPGAYEYQDFVYNLEKLPLTYTFKDSGRARNLPGIKDKHVNAAPWQYETVRKPVEKKPIWHGSFKSQSPRFPAKYFVPKEGPPPGYYDPANQETKCQISSSFVSRTPRFSTSQTKVPGPGSYASTYQTPQTSTLIKMGRMHGLFFRNAFEI
ncbi:protein STPG4-like isoform X2 [Styela clava]